MSKKPFPEELLSAYLDGELSPQEAEIVRMHLAEGENAAKLEELRENQSRLRKLPSFQLDDDFAQQVMAKIDFAASSDVDLSDSEEADLVEKVSLPSKASQPQSWRFSLATIAALAALVLVVIMVQPPEREDLSGGPDLGSEFEKTRDGTDGNKSNGDLPRKFDDADDVDDNREKGNDSPLENAIEPNIKKLEKKIAKEERGGHASGSDSSSGDKKFKGIQSKDSSDDPADSLIDEKAGDMDGKVANKNAAKKSPAEKPGDGGRGLPPVLKQKSDSKTDENFLKDTMNRAGPKNGIGQLAEPQKANVPPVRNKKPSQSAGDNSVNNQPGSRDKNDAENKHSDLVDSKKTDSKIAGKKTEQKNLGQQFDSKPKRSQTADLSNEGSLPVPKGGAGGGFRGGKSADNSRRGNEEMGDRAQRLVDGNGGFGGNGWGGGGLGGGGGYNNPSSMVPPIVLNQSELNRYNAPSQTYGAQGYNADNNRILQVKVNQADFDSGLVEKTLIKNNIICDLPKTQTLSKAYSNSKNAEEDDKAKSNKGLAGNPKQTGNPKKTGTPPSQKDSEDRLEIVNLKNRQIVAQQQTRFLFIEATSSRLNSTLKELQDAAEIYPHVLDQSLGQSNLLVQQQPSQQNANQQNAWPNQSNGLQQLNQLNRARKYVNPSTLPRNERERFYQDNQFGQQQLPNQLGRQDEHSFTKKSANDSKNADGAGNKSKYKNPNTLQKPADPKAQGGNDKKESEKLESDETKLDAVDKDENNPKQRKRDDRKNDAGKDSSKGKSENSQQLDEKRKLNRSSGKQSVPGNQSVTENQPTQESLQSQPPEINQLELQEIQSFLGMDGNEESVMRILLVIQSSEKVQPNRVNSTPKDAAAKQAPLELPRAKK